MNDINVRTQSIVSSKKDISANIFANLKINK